MGEITINTAVTIRCTVCGTFIGFSDLPVGHPCYRNPGGKAFCDQHKPKPTPPAEKVTE